MSENKMNPLFYFVSHLYWAWLSCLFFMARLFVPLVSPFSGMYLSVEESQTVLLVLVTFCVTIGFFATLKHHRNDLHVALNILSPFGIYLVFEMVPYLPLYFWCGALLCGGAIIFCGYQTFFAPVRSKENKSRAMCRRIGHFVHSSRFAVNSLLALIALVSATVSLFGVRLTDSGRNYIREADSSFSYLTENRRACLNDLAPEQWSGLSVEKKTELLQLVIDTETVYLGLPDRIDLVVDDLEPATLGSYRHDIRQITIDIDSVTNSSSAACLDIALHEVYHSYQHHLCEAYNDTNGRYRKLIGLRSASTYIYEFANYVDGNADFENYAQQRVEEDAREYAHTRISEYNCLLMPNNEK